MAELNEHELIMQMTDGLNKAMSAARGLVHHQRNYTFVHIANLLEQVKDKCLYLATSKAMKEVIVQNMATSHEKATSKIIMN